MDDDESIPDSNQDHGELENEMKSDNESNYKLPDDKSTFGSNENTKKKYAPTYCSTKKVTKSQKEGREHIKRKY